MLNRLAEACGLAAPEPAEAQHAFPRPADVAALDPTTSSRAEYSLVGQPQISERTLDLDLSTERTGSQHLFEGSITQTRGHYEPVFKGCGCN